MNKPSSGGGVNRRICGGALTGAANGLFGGGGGMIAVPLLAALPGYTQKSAHATAIAVIAPVCAVSAVFYLFGGFASADVIIPATLGNVAGGMIGAKLLGKLPSVVVNVLFLTVMLAAGIRMMI